MLLHFAALLGRALLCAIFLLSGVGKLIAWDQTAQMMENQGMVAVPFLLAGAIAFELGGGLLLLLGLWARLGAFVLLVFLVPTTLVFHSFWTYEGEQYREQMVHFMKNLAIMGGLLTVFAEGAGGWRIDAVRNGGRSRMTA
jgi:putative oxidoreductase